MLTTEEFQDIVKKNENDEIIIVSDFKWEVKSSNTSFQKTLKECLKKNIKIMCYALNDNGTQNRIQKLERKINVLKDNDPYKVIKLSDKHTIMVNSYSLYIITDKNSEQHIFIGIHDSNKQFFKELIYGTDTENPVDDIIGHINNLMENDYGEC